MTQEDLDFNEGTSLWRGKMLKDMTRLELYKSFNEMTEFYERAMNVAHEAVDSLPD